MKNKPHKFLAEESGNQNFQQMPQAFEKQSVDCCCFLFLLHKKQCSEDFDFTKCNLTFGSYMCNSYCEQCKILLKYSCQPSYIDRQTAGL